MNAITEIGSKILDLATIHLMIERLNREPETEIFRRQTEVIPQTKNILYLYIFMALKTNYLLYII